MKTTHSDALNALVSLGEMLDDSNSELSLAITKTYIGNNWLTKENYSKVLSYWKNVLTTPSLAKFVSNYDTVRSPQRIGIIMAGNIPMVGFHDLMCVILSGHKAIVKPSSDDKDVISYLCSKLNEFGAGQQIEEVDKLDNIDAVIATGSNNSHRYFEYYFRDKPSILRKNRKSIAVLSGSETDEELNALSYDVFDYYGLGCRNVSTLAIPEDMDITKILDHFMNWKQLLDHNKYANNYTYHRAILLMNQAEHLDTGFCLIQEKKELNAPLACIYYFKYRNDEEIKDYVDTNSENIQCVVGNYSDVCTVKLGSSQTPDLQDYADNVDTMKFLVNLD